MATDDATCLCCCCGARGILALAYYNAVADRALCWACYQRHVARDAEHGVGLAPTELMHDGGTEAELRRIHKLIYKHAA